MTILAAAPGRADHVFGDVAPGGHADAERHVVDARAARQALVGHLSGSPLGAADAAVRALQRSHGGHHLGDRHLHGAGVGAGATLAAAPDVFGLEKVLDVARQDQSHDPPRPLLEVEAARAGGHALAALVALAALLGQREDGLIGGLSH